ncbi:atherin-like [Odocoileus virginianus]|uniref:Atherin-like n=1 Tax=Odocoileus virginianus TaxID=9874 RepID=A0ABM4J9V7_ODOVR
MPSALAAARPGLLCSAAGRGERRGWGWWAGPRGRGQGREAGPSPSVQAAPRRLPAPAVSGQRLLRAASAVPGESRAPALKAGDPRWTRDAAPLPHLPLQGPRAAARSRKVERLGKRAFLQTRGTARCGGRNPAPSRAAPRRRPRPATPTPVPRSRPPGCGEYPARRITRGAAGADVRRAGAPRGPIGPVRLSTRRSLPVPCELRGRASRPPPPARPQKRVSTRLSMLARSPPRLDAAGPPGPDAQGRRRCAVRAQVRQKQPSREWRGSGSRASEPRNPVSTLVL